MTWARYGRATRQSISTVQEAERVDVGGDVLLLTSDELRRQHLGAAVLADRRAYERDPGRAVRVRSHEEVLEEHGLAAFPKVLASSSPVLVYETGTLLGRLLGELAAGRPVEDLTAEILEHAAEATAR
ncbi:hypothetical protein [Streptomyces hydrogenans]|uniref:hypothetical protein n=1 Tax=Streptomyces hydrogenans TaxID=1873719 RepID=UPI0037F3F036